MRRRQGIAVALGAVAFVALAWNVASASAARLPTPKEGKALTKAFRRDDRHPDDAIIANVRISTVNKHWSEVRWFAPRGHNRVLARRSRALSPRGVPRPAKATGKPLRLHTSIYSGNPRHPRPATKRPPKKVKRDLKHDLLAILTYSASGEEKADFSGTSDSCAETADGENIPYTFEGHLFSTFSWTATWRIDTEKVLDYLPDDNGDPVAILYVATPVDPTIGSGSDRYTYSNEDNFPECGDEPVEFSCNPTYPVVKQPAAAVFESTGVNLTPPVEESNDVCSDGAPTYVHYNPRWSLAPDPSLPPDAGAGHRGFFNEVAIAPLSIVASFGIAVDPVPISFPDSVAHPDDVNTESTTTGLCEDPDSYDTCTDRLTWSGSAKIDLAP